MRVAALAAVLLGGAALPAWSIRNSNEEPWVAGSMEARAPGQTQRLVLPLRKTQVHLEITGGLVKAEVNQVFKNDTANRLEAIYTFPLPSTATVTDMEIRIDDRLIRSVVKEKQEAKETYEKAKKEGKSAALLEQERPNMFTMSVANFGPGEKAEVKLTYVQQADYQKGLYSVTFPMVVGPRYIPKDGTGRGADDADRISPPVLPPWIDPGHRLTLTAEVSGLPVKEIKSSTHALTVKTAGKTEKVSLARPLTLPNKDFDLDIYLKDSADADFSLIRTDEAEATYGLISAFPSTEEAEDEGVVDLPRDVVFLIDTSGSMSGASISQAQAGLLRCLESLREKDHFTIVRFSNNYSAFSPELRAASTDKLADAKAYVEGLDAKGGTDMQLALEYVLDTPNSEGALPIIVFLTDGAVGNEDTLMRLLNNKLGHWRLFTFGIGSAPNEFLMRKMAELGHGQSRFIHSHEDVGVVMSDFFKTLDAPVLTDIQLSWEDKQGNPVPEVVCYPSVYPDVFVERPLQVAAKFPAGFDGDLIVRAKQHGKPVEHHFPFSKASEVKDGAVTKVFGRAMIEELSYRHLTADGAVERDAVKEEIVRASLDYQLVSQFTSRVAVEEKLTRNVWGKLVSTRVPTALPEGWETNQFFGTATTAVKQLVLGGLALLGVVLLEIFRRWRLKGYRWRGAFS